MNTLGLIWGIGTAAGQWAAHQMTPRDIVIVAILLPVTAATTGWIAVAVLRRRRARLALVVHTAQCFGQVFVFLALWQDAPGQVLAPLAFSVELAAAAAWTCLAWPVAVADLLITVSVGGAVMARTGAMGPRDAVVLNIGNSAYYGAIGLAGTMAWTAIVTAVRTARRAGDASAESAAALASAQEAAVASNRWDGVIHHDHVLNTLSVAAHWATRNSSQEPVRILARGALEALSRTRGPRPATSPADLRVAAATTDVRLAGQGHSRTMVAFVTLALAISLSLGWMQHGDVVRMPAQVGLSVILLAASAVAFLWRPLGVAAQAAVAAVTVCCQTLMLANLRAGAPLSWQEWFIGFGIGVFAPLAWRTRSRWWVLVVAASWPVVTLAGAALGGGRPVIVMLSRLSSYTWPLILTFAATWAAVSMKRSLDAVVANRARAFEAAREKACTDAARHEAERRLTTIKGEPMEMLQHLAGGGEITDAVRRRCVLLEASTRDLLVAPFIMDETMRGRFRAARERGAVVTITGGDPVPEGFADAADAFRRICVILADEGCAGHRLTCRWHPGRGGGATRVSGSGGPSVASAAGSDVATVALMRDDDAAGPPWGSLPGFLADTVACARARVDVDDGGSDLLVTIGG